MANNIEIELPFTARHKSTPLYISKGKLFFGVWVAPNITLDGDERRYKINQAEVGQLNTVAFREYQDSTLWWAIAHVNNFGNIPEEVTAGLEIIIPKIANIRAALQEETEGA